VAYQNGASTCPRCGSSADVRTVRELFDTLNSPQGQAFQRLSQQFGWPGAGAGQGQPPAQGPSATQGYSTAGGQSASEGYAAAGGQSASQAPPVTNAGGFANQSYFPKPGQSSSQGPGADQGQAASQAQPPTSQAQPPGQAWPPAGQAQAPGQGPYQSQGGNNDDYDHYSAESGRRGNRNRNWTDFDIGENIADDIGGAVLGAALGFAGRAIGRRMKKALEDKVVPAMQAKMQLSQQQLEQQKAEQDAIVARYPELRGCMKDQVVFLDGGMQTIPVNELSMPVTLAKADAVVARLR
jgi:hypothetical protein